MNHPYNTAYLDDYGLLTLGEVSVTRAEAILEIEIHGINPNEFLEEMGDHETYAAADVLAWLGVW